MYQKRNRIIGAVVLGVVLFALIATVLSVSVRKESANEITARKLSSVKPITPAKGELGAEERNAIEVFERSSPAVVFIKNASLVQFPFFSLDIYEIPQGSGSGLIWDDRGYIVTNFHVINNASKIEVVLGNRTTYRARVIGLAPGYDLAVIKIDASIAELVSLPIAGSHELRVGQTVFAIGNPFGLDHSLSKGVISAVDRTITALTGRKIEGVIQTDAAINPGNSGGPLIDSYGRVIGINTAIRSTSGGNAGVGFAVPINTVNRIVPQLIMRGRIAKAGIKVSLVPDAIRKRWGMEGALILLPREGGPAAQAGLIGTQRDTLGSLRLGDLITEIDNHKIRSNSDLLSYFETESEINKKVEIKYVRSHRKGKVSVLLEAI